MQLFTHILLILFLAFVIQCHKIIKKQITKSGKTGKTEIVLSISLDSSEKAGSGSVKHAIADELEKFINEIVDKSEEARRNKESEETEETEEIENTEIEVIDNHLSVDKYSWANSKFATVINPFEEFRFSSGNVNSFKSVWLKCAACLGIANKINLTFQDFYDNNYYLSPNEFSQRFRNPLEETCRNGFKNYDLREYKGNLVVARASVHSNHVPSKIDGEWTKLLSEICYNYIKNLNYNRLLNQHVAGCLKIDDFFCRSEGLYRDCNNLDLQYLEDPQYKGTIMLSLYIQPI